MMGNENSVFTECQERFDDIVGQMEVLAKDIIAGVWNTIEKESGVKKERIFELIRADLDGRCVLIPDGGYTDKDGENALKYAMNACSCQNNPVTRYIADAVAEKLCRESGRNVMFPSGGVTLPKSVECRSLGSWWLRDIQDKEEGREDGE